MDCLVSSEQTVLSSSFPIQIGSDSAQSLYYKTLQILSQAQEVPSVHTRNSVGSGWGTRERPTKELRCATLVLSNPRDRLINSPLFALEKIIPRTILGTLSDELSVSTFAFYEPNVYAFSDDKETMPTNYGYRIRHFNGANQIDQVIRQFKEDPNTRRAVIHIHATEDLNRNYNPCVDSLHFLIRDNTLECHSFWRSENALTLLPVNLFEFTMLQELIASELGISPGQYVHTVTSLHYYLDDQEKLETVLKALADREKPKLMDPMDLNSLTQVDLLRDYERKLRTQTGGETIEGLSQYWRNFAEVLAYAVAKKLKGLPSAESLIQLSPWKSLIIKD